MRILFVLAVFFISLFSSPIHPDIAFKVVPEANNTDIKVKFDVNETVRLYKKDLKIHINSSEISEFLNMPEALDYKEFKIYKGKFDIFIPLGLVLSSGNLDKFSLKIDFMACADSGFCYPPLERSFEFIKKDDKYEIMPILNAKGEKQKPSSLPNSQNDIANLLKTSGIFTALAVFFGYGLMLSLTPCIFPMIPILSSIIVAKIGTGENVKSGFWISFVYVFAMALAYALIGASASLLGASLQMILQIPAVIMLFTLIFVVLAFGMFGFYEIKMPSKLQTIITKKSEGKSGMGGVFIMGFLSALIVGPCVAAPLAGALLYIAQSGDILLGALALFVMSFGMGVPLLAIGIGSKKILPKPGKWMNLISQIFGFLLLGMAIWMSSRVIGENLALLFYSLLGVIFASFIGIFEGDKIRRGVAIFVLIYSILLLIGFASGAKNALKPLENLLISQNSPVKNELNFTKVSNWDELNEIIENSKKPVMIDFWASWCENCKELENITFKDPLVVSKLVNFELVKIDITKSSSEDKALMKKFSIFGPPALVFYKDKKELENLQISGYIEPLRFAKVLDEI